MPQAEPLIIHTTKDGELVDPKPADMDALFEQLKKKERVVLHFHGGLVNYAGGVSVARRLDPIYRSADAHPVFFVWEAGLLEVLRNNIAEIAGEDFFKIILKYVTRFAIGKVREATGLGGKSLGLSMPNDMELHVEFAKRDIGREPFEQLAIPRAVDELTDEQADEFARQLEQDIDFQETVAAIAESALDEPLASGARGIDRVRAAGRSLISPEIVEDLRDDRQAALAGGQKGLLSAAKIIKHAVVILARVVKRFRANRDHGVYPTIVEEILREFYLANAGVKVWAAMKGETSDTFGDTNPVRGGWLFARKLHELVLSGTRPTITLVGHSTGAVFIINLLRHLATLREAAQTPLPRDFAIENVVLLAPACRFDDFSALVAPPFHTGAADTLYKNLRMFTMRDEAESRDQLIPYVYTRSLLYFISGVLEPGLEGESAPDVPIVGMERYYTGAQYDTPAIAAVKGFIRAQNGRAVWAPVANGPAGLLSTATSHTAFDDDQATLSSVVALIRS